MLAIESFGANTKIVLNQFDNPSGRNVVIASLDSNVGGIGGSAFPSMPFKTEINSDEDFNVRGNAGAGTGICGIMMRVTELPR